MGPYYGDYAIDKIVRMRWGSYDGGTGASITQTALVAADVIIFKNGNIAQKVTTNGIAVFNDFDTRTGLHYVTIDTSNDTGDAGFWVAGADYDVAIDAVTIDGQTVRMWIGSFSTENRFMRGTDSAALATNYTAGRATNLDNLDALVSSRLAPTVAARTLDIAATGEAGLDFGNTVGTHPSVALTAAAVDAIWDELMAGHVTADSAAVRLKDILDDVTGIAGAAMRGTDGVDTGTHAALVNLIWNELTAEARTAASYGQLFKDNVNATISSRAIAGDAMALTAAAVDAIWDEVLTGAAHNVVNSAGRRIRQQQEAGTYSLGAIWVDTVNGVAGTTNFENGVFLNPVDTMADANTIAVSLTIARFVMGSGSVITFAAAQANQTFLGKNWTLALGGQNIGGSHINGAEVSGVSTGAPSFDHCHLNICTFAGGEFTDCALQDAITLSGAVGYAFINCYHAESGAPSTIDFGAAVGATEVHLHNWHGNITILNMKAGDILHFTCADGTLTLDATCTAGTVNLAGTFGLTDSSSGMTINDNGQMYQRVGAPVGADISADIAAVKAETDKLALVDAGAGVAGSVIEEIENRAIPGDAMDLITDAIDVVSILEADLANAVLTGKSLAELGVAIPSATPTLEAAIMLLYMTLRNKLDVDASFKEVHNNAGSVIAKKALTDDATTYSEAEMVAGP